MGAQAAPAGCLQAGMFTAKAGEYWGNFGAVQDDIQAAYSGNAEANVDAFSSGSVGRH
jgi:hypothetical protein